MTSHQVKERFDCSNSTYKIVQQFYLQNSAHKIVPIKSPTRQKHVFVIWKISYELRKWETEERKYCLSSMVLLEFQIFSLVIVHIKMYSIVLNCFIEYSDNIIVSGYLVHVLLYTYKFEIDFLGLLNFL